MMKQMLNKGTLSIAEEVFSIIVGVALSDIDGVASVASGVRDDFFHVMRNKGSHKGIEIEQEGHSIRIKLKVAITYGKSIKKVTYELQEYIKQEVELLTGIHVEAVNIIVEQIVYNKK